MYAKGTTASDVSCIYICKDVLECCILQLGGYRLSVKQTSWHATQVHFEFRLGLSRRLMDSVHIVAGRAGQEIRDAEEQDDDQQDGRCEMLAARHGGMNVRERPLPLVSGYRFMR